MGPGGEFTIGKSPSTSSTLIDRAKRREQDAWERLAELYGPLVYVWCRRVGISAEDARDVVQEVFLAVLGGIGQFRGGRRAAFRAWLRQITRNKVYDDFRARKGSPLPEGGSSAWRRLVEVSEAESVGDGGSAGESDASRDEVWQHAVRLVRAQFADHLWAAFWRTTVDEQPAAEVAEELDMSVAAVYQAKSRILRRLRQVIAELEAVEQ